MLLRLAAILLPLVLSSGALAKEETCAECHPELVESLGGKFEHKPFAERDCEACHVFHGFRNRMELREGDHRDLCLECHLETVDLPEDNLHSPLMDDDGCTTCHTPHGGPHDKLLRLPPEEICLDCHDGPDDFEGTLHAPFEKKQCLECHSPHGSLFPPNLNLPAHYVCIGCHEELIGDIPLEEMHAFEDGRSCERCHVPHAGAHDHLLVTDPARLCVGCHEDMGELVTTGKAHGALSEGSCVDCHDVHFRVGSPLPAVEPSLCFRCHEEVRDRMELPVVHDAAEDCDSCHGPHERIDLGYLPELCGDCHEVDEDDFLQKHAGRAPRSCTACHDPHGTEKENLLRAVQHEPFADRDCDTCHGEAPERLRSDELCLDCHDAPEDAGGHGRSLMAGRRCIDCHTPHAAEKEHLLR